MRDKPASAAPLPTAADLRAALRLACEALTQLVGPTRARITERTSFTVADLAGDVLDVRFRIDGAHDDAELSLVVRCEDLLRLSRSIVRCEVSSAAHATDVVTELGNIVVSSFLNGVAKATGRVHLPSVPHTATREAAESLADNGRTIVVLESESGLERWTLWLVVRAPGLPSHARPVSG